MAIWADSVDVVDVGNESGMDTAFIDAALTCFLRNKRIQLLRGGSEAVLEVAANYIFCSVMLCDETGWLPLRVRQ